MDKKYVRKSGCVSTLKGKPNDFLNGTDLYALGKAINQHAEVLVQLDKAIKSRSRTIKTNSGEDNGER